MSSGIAGDINPTSHGHPPPLGPHQHLLVFKSKTVTPKNQSDLEKTLSHVAFFLANLVSNNQNNGLKILFQVQLSLFASGTSTISYEQFMDNGRISHGDFFMEFWQKISWITNNKTHSWIWKQGGCGVDPAEVDGHNWWGWCHWQSLVVELEKVEVVD